MTCRRFPRTASILGRNKGAVASMENGQDFVDYYELIQVSPDCEPRILEVAYHYFAKMYHPDNPATANMEKFQQVVDAYGVLRDPQKRAKYDSIYAERQGHPIPSPAPSAEFGLDEDTAVADADMHNRILLSLYKQRRERPGDAGVVGWLLQEKLECAEDLFDFHVWYLKSKGLIDINEQGQLAINVAGVDHVITLGRTKAVEQLRITQMSDEQPQD